MITIVVNNSTCQITGLGLEDFKDLRDALSYSVGNQASYFSGAFGSRRYLLDKRGMFPTGLINRVKTYLGEQKLDYVVRDLRRVPEPIQGLFNLKLRYTPHEWQVKAVEALIESGGRSICTAPTGAGKATIVAMLIAAYNLKSLIIVPTLELKKQLSHSLKEAFGSLNNIRVENVDSLDPKKPETDVELLILDEYHLSASKRYQKLNLKAWKNIYYRIGLTATNYRNLDEEQLLLESIVSSVAYKLTYQESINKKYIAPLQVFYVELPLTQMKGNPKNWHAVSSELIVNNLIRNTAVADIVESLEASDESTLVLVKEIRQAHNIQEILENSGLNIAVASGDNDNNRELLLEFNLRKRNTLIATGILGVGVDTKPCKYVILAAGGKSRPQLIQNIGRCLRTYSGKEVGTAIIFLDKSSPYLIKHFKAVKKAILEEYNVELIKL